MWLAYLYLGQETPSGVFTDEAMAKAWAAEWPNRYVLKRPNLDKTFATMAVEYNSKYEG